MSKRGIELNGVANMSMLLDLLKSDLEKPNSNGWNEACIGTTYSSIREQLILLERYMLAYNDAVNEGRPTPMWHEVRSNPQLYPTNRERVG